MKAAPGLTSAALLICTALIFTGTPAFAGAPLKGVDVKLGKAEAARCAADGSAGTDAAGGKDTKGAQASPPAGCAAREPAPGPGPSPGPAPAAQGRQATKTRSNIQNN